MNSTPPTAEAMSTGAPPLQVGITPLYYWKTDHTEKSCQDAYAYDARRGLFAVADGVAQSLFSEVWSRLLVQRFMRLPLRSADPFEVEWWLTDVQAEYRASVPKPDELPVIARDKAREGSASTLVGFSVSAIGHDTAPYVDICCIAVGDSCIIIDNGDSADSPGKILAWPLDDPTLFDNYPEYLPTQGYIPRYSYHRCQVRGLRLRPGMVVMMATDAVSHWILNSGNGSYPSAVAAFRDVCSQTPESWPGYIERCRTQRAMKDDDSTALILRIGDQSAAAEPLGVAPRPTQEALAQRRQVLAQALLDDNDAAVARAFGDGYIMTYPQKVAEALGMLRLAYNSAQSEQQRRVQVQQTWATYSEFLRTASSAQRLLRNLAAEGLIDADQLADQRVLTASEESPLAGEEQAVAAEAPLSALVSPGEQSGADTKGTPVATSAHQEPGPSTGSSQPLVATPEPATERVLQQAPGDSATPPDAIPDRRAVTAPPMSDPGPVEPGSSLPQSEGHQSGPPGITESTAPPAPIDPVLEPLNKAIAEEDDDAIIDAHILIRAAKQDSRLTSEQMQRISEADERMLALTAFAEACATDDDARIIRAYKPFLSRLRGFTDQHRERHELAEKRSRAFRRWYDALATNIPEKIAEAYNPILETSPLFTDKYRERYREARSRMTGMKQQAPQSRDRPEIDPSVVDSSTQKQDSWQNLGPVTPRQGMARKNAEPGEPSSHDEREDLQRRRFFSFKKNPK